MWFYFILLSQITTVKHGPEAGRVIPELKGKLVRCVNWKVTVGALMEKLYNPLHQLKNKIMFREDSKAFKQFRKGIFSS